MGFGILEFVAIGILISFVTFGILNYMKSKRGFPDVGTIKFIINHHLSKSENHSIGIISNIEFNEGRVKVNFYAIDVDDNKSRDENVKEKLKEYEIFYDVRQVRINSFLEHSGHTTIVEALPSRADLLTSQQKEKNPELLWRLDKNNKMKEESELYKINKEELLRLTKTFARGEIPREAIKKLKEVVKDTESSKKDENKFTKWKENT